MSDTIQGEQSSPSLQERLRAVYVFGVGTEDLTNEAADEIDRLKRELETIEHEAALVYSYLTDGKISKCNTAAEYVIDAAEESNRKWADKWADTRVEEAVAAKDRRIEELEKDVARIEDDKAFWKNPPNGVWVEKDAINAAWEMAQDLDRRGTAWAGPLLRKLGIIPHPKCGGTKHIAPDFDYTIDDTCDCPNNGWVMEATDD